MVIQIAYLEILPEIKPTRAFQKHHHADLNLDTYYYPFVTYIYLLFYLLCLYID